MRLREAAGLASVVVVLGVTFGHLLGPFDLLTFLRAGRAVLHGASPYASPTSPVFRSGHAFVYPLFVAWLFAPLGALPTQVAEAAYSIGSVGAVVASCRLLGRRGPDAPALVLVSSTTIIGLQMGTLNALLLLGLACAWFWRDSRPVLAGVVLGATATAKLFLLPVLLWPLLRRRSRLAASALTAVAVLLVCSASLGQLSPLGYVEMMAKLDAREQVISWSLSSFLQGLGAGRGVATFGAVLVAAAGLAILYHRRAATDDRQVLGALIVCSLLLSPILWSSYLLLLTVPLLLGGRGRLLPAFALVSWAMVTPDAAPAPRVVAGVALAALVAVTATVADARGVVPGGVVAGLAAGRSQVVRLVLLSSALAVFALLMLLLPAPARSPLPALSVMGAVGLWCVRPSRPGHARLGAGRRAVAELAPPMAWSDLAPDRRGP